MDNKIEKKYKNIGYAEFNDSILLSKRQRIWIDFAKKSPYIFISITIIIYFISRIISGLDAILAISLFSAVIVSLIIIIFTGKYVIKQSVKLLGEEYFRYKEEYYKKNHIVKIFMRNSFIEWKEYLLTSKRFSKGYCTYKVRFPITFAKAVFRYLDYNLMVFFDKLPDNATTKPLLDKKRINLVYCIKAIDEEDIDNSKINSLLEPGYKEIVIDTLIVRFAYIYYNKSTEQLIHRPRVVLLYPQDHFMKKFKYAKEPSVVVDYSMDISYYLLTKILQLDVGSD